MFEAKEEILDWSIINIGVSHFVSESTSFNGVVVGYSPGGRDWLVLIFV